jgi:hypothetical protein
VGSTQVRDAEGEISADAQERLDRDELSCHARLRHASDLERGKRFVR